MANKTPELDVLLEKLEAERGTIQKQVVPIQAEYDAVVAKIQPLEAQAREIRGRIKAIEQDRLRDVCNQIASIYRAKGARTLQAV
jgi:predicted  nucleic acid-binding Zn-ribbon protein